MSGAVDLIYYDKKQIIETGHSLLLPEPKFFEDTIFERDNQLNYFEYDVGTNTAAGIIGGVEARFDNRIARMNEFTDLALDVLNLGSSEFKEAVLDNNGFRLSSMLGFNVIGTYVGQKYLSVKATPELGYIPRYAEKGVYGYTSPIYMQISVYGQDQFINRTSFELQKLL